MDVECYYLTNDSSFAALRRWFNGVSSFWRDWDLDLKRFTFGENSSDSSSAVLDLTCPDYFSILEDGVCWESIKAVHGYSLKTRLPLLLRLFLLPLSSVSLLVSLILDLDFWSYSSSICYRAL